MTWTRRVLRREVGQKQLGDTWVSTTTSASANPNTLIDTNMYQPDDAFNGAQVYIVDGTYAGSYRYIVDWVRAAGLYVVDRPFGAAIATSVNYEIHRHFDIQMKNNAINRAIRDAGWRWPARLESEVIEMENTTYRYRIVNTTNTNAITSSSPTDAGTLTVGNTAGFPSSGWLKVENEYIAYSAIASSTTFTLAASGSRGANSSTAAAHAAGVAIGVAPRLERRAAQNRAITKLLYDTGLSGTGPPWRELDDDFWEIRDNNGELNLQLSCDVPKPDYHFRLVYEAKPLELSAETDTLDPDDDGFAGFISARAASILCSFRAIQEKEAPGGLWHRQADQFQAQALMFQGVDRPPRQPGRVKYPTWGDSGVAGEGYVELPVDNIRI